MIQKRALRIIFPWVPYDQRRRKQSRTGGGGGQLHKKRQFVLLTNKQKKLKFRKPPVFICDFGDIIFNYFYKNKIRICAKILMKI
jgi:hypothetical protein